MELEKPSFENQHSNILFSQETSKDAKINLKIHIFNILICLKGKKIILWCRILASTSLIKISKLTFPIMGQTEIVYYLIGCNKKKTASVF